MMIVLNLTNLTLTIDTIQSKIN